MQRTDDSSPPPPGAPVRPRAGRPDSSTLLDRAAVALALAGAGCVLTGLLPRAEAEATLARILPLLLFLGSVVVLAELTASAGVFDVLATRLAITAGGNQLRLFGLCVAFASVTTITLNLDTTAVLLTPVMLALARRLRSDPVPLAMTTVWLANTASLLLPVSNLTNLLASDRIGLDTGAFAARMWLPQLVVVVVTAVLLWWCHWRGPAAAGRGRYPLPQRFVPADRLLHRIATLACLLFLAGLLAGLEIGLASGLAAAVLVGAFALRRRAALRPALLPWRLLLLVTGLFLVVQTIGRYGLNELVAVLVATDGGASGAFRAGAVGALLANTVNNLPAYLAGEAVLPVSDQTRLLALLIGTNVGPLAVPWASLATLLWYERCRSAGVRVPMRRFVSTSALLAVVGTGAGITALLLTG